MIDKILLIPKDPEILEVKSACFLPPQAFLDGTKSGMLIWRLYNPLENYPNDKEFHTFALVLAWDKKPVYPGLDYFFRLYSGLPFEWPINWGTSDRNLKDIVSKVRTFGMRPDSYGELVIVNSVHQELSWPKLRVK